MALPQTHLKDPDHYDVRDNVFALSVMGIEDKHPEIWKALPEATRQKLEDLNPDGLADLMETQPEVFKKSKLMENLEDTAWEALLQRRGLLPNGQPAPSSAQQAT
jgi:hypothetical protein